MAPFAPRTAQGRRVCDRIADLAGFLAEQAAENDREGRFASGSVDRLVDAGVLTACVPEEVGGGGVRSLHDLAALTAALGRADASIAVATYMHLTLTWYFTRLVDAAPDGADLPQRDWVTAIGERRMVVCSAVTETGADYWHVATTAIRSARGWVVNGRKVLASISPAATHFYTRVRAGDALGTVMIPRGTPGLEVRDNWDGLGLRGSGSGEVVFRDCALPAPAFSPRTGWGTRDARLLEGRALALVGLAAVYLGVAESARDIAVAALTRTGPDRRRREVGTASRAALAELEIALATARGVLRTVLDDADAHARHYPPRTAPAPACHALMAACHSASAVVERNAQTAVDLAMQLTGGAGYLRRHPLARMCRDVRAATFMRPFTPPEAATDFLVDGVLSPSE